MDLEVGVGPDLLEAGIDRRGFIRLALAAEAFGQAEERPAVFGKALEVFAVELLGVGELAGFHQHGAERMAHDYVSLYARLCAGERSSGTELASDVAAA